MTPLSSIIKKTHTKHIQTCFISTFLFLFLQNSALYILRYQGICTLETNSVIIARDQSHTPYIISPSASLKRKETLIIKPCWCDDGTPQWIYQM